MSDVFNSSANKVRFSELVGGKQTLDTLPSDIEVETLVTPAQPKTSLAESNTKMAAADVAALVAEKGLKVFKPYYIPENEGYELATVFDETIVEYFNAQTQALLVQNPKEYALPDRVLLPTGKPTLQKYMPTYTIGQYDQQLFNSIMFQFLLADGQTVLGKKDKPVTRSKPLDQEYSVQCALRIRTACSAVALSSGTVAGQLTRMKDMQDIRHGVNGKFKPVQLMTLGLDNEAFAKVLEKTLHVSAIPGDGTELMLRYIPSDWIISTADPTTGHIAFNDKTPQFRAESKSGPPYAQRFRKGDTYASALAMADIVITEYEKVMLQDSATARNNFLKKHIYLAMCFLFPKEERYLKSALSTKTRNIASMSQVTHMLISHLHDPTLGRTKYNAVTTNAYDSPSLQKFTAFFTNLQKFLDQGLNIGGGKSWVPKGVPGQHRDFIYADNWYMFYYNDDGTIDYFSLDLEKGEANATPDVAQACMYYLLTRGFITEGGVVAFSSTWASFLMQIAPACIVDSIAVFRNMQLRFPGQLSGNTLTFVINHAVTTKLRHFWKLADSPKPGSPEFNEVCRRTGVNIKIEQHTKDIMSEYNRVIAETPKTGFLQDEKEDSVNDRGESYFTNALPRLKLDLLGYDAVYSHQLSRYIPVLAQDRMDPSLMWPRRSLGDHNKNMLRHELYRLVRYEMLRIMGAWSDPMIDQALHNMAKNIRNRFKSQTFTLDASDFMTKEDLAPDLANAFAEAGLDASFTSKFKMTQEMLVKLNSPKNTPSTKPNILDLSRNKLLEDGDRISAELRNIARFKGQQMLPKKEFVRYILDQIKKEVNGLSGYATLLGKYDKLLDLVEQMYEDPSKLESLHLETDLWVREVNASMRRDLKALSHSFNVEVQGMAAIKANYLKDVKTMADPMGATGAGETIRKQTVTPAVAPDRQLTRTQKKNFKRKMAKTKLQEELRRYTES